MAKIIKIQKSIKKDGYVYVWFMNGKGTLRKVYQNKKGQKFIYVDCITYQLREDKENEGFFEYKMVTEQEGPTPIDMEQEQLQEAISEVITEIFEGKHSKYMIIKACIESDIPVYLYGPAGSGKNFTLQQIAEDLKLDFYFTNSVQQEFKVTGFIDAGGNFHETEFYKAFKNGGLFFLDEMDASIPEVLVLLNAAIANRYFEFPNGRIDAHEDFRVVAAGNTIGNGGNEQYTGRLELDQATLDRFVAIEFDYDKNIELMLAKGNKELVEFIRDLREKASSLGVRTTFSYRCIISVSKLEGNLDLVEVLKIAVLKGLDKDTINTIIPVGYTKYHSAMKKLAV